MANVLVLEVVLEGVHRLPDSGHSLSVAKIAALAQGIGFKDARYVNVEVILDAFDLVHDAGNMLISVIERHYLVLEGVSKAGGA